MKGQLDDPEIVAQRWSAVSKALIKPKWRKIKMAAVPDQELLLRQRTKMFLSMTPKDM